MTPLLGNLMGLIFGSLGLLSMVVAKESQLYSVEMGPRALLRKFNPAMRQGNAAGYFVGDRAVMSNFESMKRRCPKTIGVYIPSHFMSEISTHSIQNVSVNACLFTSINLLFAVHASVGSTPISGPSI